ncbi:hypothetical protein E4U21_001962 [Claviceps maximensis]|nr:hypothetical protein E4U21_001962 [Claviceps maximensis]
MTTSRAWPPWRHDGLDEEMANKKTDDPPMSGYPKHRTRLSTSSSTSTNWTASRMPRRSWVKRLTVYAIIATAIFFLFFRRRDHSTSVFGSIGPSTGSWTGYDPIERAYDERFGPDNKKEGLAGRVPPAKAVGIRPAAKAAGGQDSLHHSPLSKDPIEKHQKALGDAASGGSLKSRPKYDGPVHLPALSSTLRAISVTGGSLRKNRNVLFAAASLKSVSTLLPMACEMAMELHNYVHFAFMGVADISMTELLEINGIDKACHLVTHDARPDHFESSTEHRTKIAVTKALYHINAYMHPQAVILDSTAAEDNYFLAPARDQILSTSAALIELPDQPGKNLGWILKLDSSALAAWNNVRFDILIQATSTKTANLERLLKSIAGANFAGIHTPHITIELPNEIEKSLDLFLSRFKWPRPTPRGGHQSPMLSLRRRITRQPLDEEDSSVRFVESFWPTDPLYSHVLVLSPHTEITPQFFQYVKYTLLHQLYSAIALTETYDASLMGISFSIPHTLADGTTAFSPPASEERDRDPSTPTAFLWQRPNSEAMLFTGKKWIELHHFISRTLYHKKTTSSSSSASALLAQKTAGKKYPAWLEYALQLSRLRGYYTLYPSKPTAYAILGVHSEIPEPPEEYQKDAAEAAAAQKAPHASLEDETTELFDSVSPVDMLQTLPEGGKLQTPAEMPLLSWDGTHATHASFSKQAQEYTALFRREVGGCTKEDKPGHGKSNDKDATDLFCGDSK